MQKLAHRWPHFSGALSILAAAVMVVLALPARPAAATLAACAIGAAAQNSITVEPSHGPVFYVDTGNSPVLDAGYVGYRVTNDTGSLQTDLWTEITGFTGGVMSLANPADDYFKLPSLADTETGTSYTLLKATGATTQAQKHTLRVYDHRPDLSNATLLYECEFTFSRVKETIKAGANKLIDNGLSSADAIEVSDTTPEVGQTIVISIEGTTGNIGGGSAPDYDILWLTPASISSWPTSALRLENVSVTFDGNGNWGTTGDQVTFDEQLLIDNANGSSVDGSEYRAYFTYRIVGVPPSSVTAVPIAQIASGTQVKHSDTGAAGATLSISFATATINATLSKNVTATTGLTVEDCTVSCSVAGAASTIYVAVPFELTAASTTATDIALDEFVDVQDAEIIFKTGSAVITDIGRTAVSVADPVFIGAEEFDDPRANHFIGPFTFDDVTSAVLEYEMWVPIGTFYNTAYALIGSTVVGATASAMSQVEVESDGSGVIIVTVTTIPFGIVATTTAVTAVTSSAATLNGTVDPNGATPLTGQFEYGTSPTLVGATTVTASTPTSGALDGLTAPTLVSVGVTGLSSGTTYYYRVKADTSYGDILSFTTPAVLASPVAATTAATGISPTGATLTGTINPNLTPITAIQFVYGTVSDLSSGTTTVTVDDGSGTLELTAGGGSTQPFEKAITGLTASTVYYYKIRACTASSGSYPSITCSASVEGSIMSFTASTPPTVTTNAASAVGGTTGTLNGTINANDLTTATSFEYGTVSDLTSGTTVVSTGDVTGSTNTATNTGLTGLSPSTTYYFRAIGTSSAGTEYGSILSFTTAASSLLSRTHTIDSGSYVSTYDMNDTEPTLTSAPSAGTGTETYTSETTGVCTVNSSTGEVTFVSAGTCTIHSDIENDGTYEAATSASISFTIELVSRTHAIDSGSYVSAYDMNDTGPTLTSAPSAGAGTETYTSETTGVCTVGSTSGVVTFVSAGTCTIHSDVASDGTYDAATSSSISFDIELVTRTHAIDSGSYVATYPLVGIPPTLTSAPSAGAGTETYTSETTGVCTVGSTSGVVTFVSHGTCAIHSDVSSDGTYDEATSSSISFTIQAPSSNNSHNPMPYDGAVTIEAGAACTPSPDVLIKMEATLATHYSIADSASGVGQVWYVYSAAPMYVNRTLPSGDGEKTVFVQFQNGSTPSIIVSDSIVLDSVYQCAPPPPPVAPPSVTEPPTTTDETDDAAVVTVPTNVPVTPGPMCEVDCNDVSYDLYIINPDGTERHTGTEYVRVQYLGGGKKLYGFEDSGRDFDHDDVQVVVDEANCSDVRYEMLGVSARWHHQLIVNVYNRGDQKFNAIILPDTHAAVGYVKSVDAKNNPAMCGAGTSAAEEPPAQPSSACSVTGLFVSALGVGSVSDEVRRLQTLLICLGHFPAEVSPTGRFAQITRAAVTAFQTAQGIDPVGFVGPLTRAALNLWAR